MTTTVDKVFLDTNVLIRFMVVTAEKHAVAEQTVNSHIQRGVELWISRQIIREYLVQVTRPQAFMEPLLITNVERQIDTIYSLFVIADETESVTSHLLNLLRQYPTRGKQIHDANIVATMLANGVDTLLTLNVADFRRYTDRIQLISVSENVG